MRFTQQLLPLLQSASPQLSRVVSVLAPGRESAAFDLKNPDLKTNFSLGNAANHAIIMTDFAFEEMAKTNATVSFVHAFPGLVNTGYTKEAGIVARTLWRLLMVLLSYWVVPLEESGARHLYAATSKRYPAQYGKEAGASVDHDTTEAVVMKGSDGEVSSGAYLIGVDGEFRANEKVLYDLRRKGAGPLIWDHTVQMFESVRG